MISHLIKFFPTIVGIVLLLPDLSLAQNLDSLWAIWNDPGQADTLRLEAMTSISKDGFLFSQPDSAYKLAQDQLEFARESQQPMFEAIALNTQGISLMVRGQKDEAIKRFEQVLAIRETLNDLAGSASAMANIGQVYFTVGKFEEAISFLDKSLKIQQEINNLTGQAIAMGNLANVYNAQGNTIQAIQYFTRTLQIMETLGRKRDILACKLNIADIFSKQGEWDSARRYFQEGIALARDINHVQFLANGLMGMGSLLHEEGKFQQALEYQKEGLKYSLTVGDPYAQGLLIHNIGMVFFSSNQLDSAEAYFQKSLVLRQEIEDEDGILESLNSLATLFDEQGKFTQAIDLSEKALFIAEEKGKLYEISRSCNILSRGYEQQGRHEEALQLLNRFIILKDSLNDIENQKTVIQQQFKYEYDKQALADSLSFVQQQAETEVAYQKQLANRNYLLFAAIALAILGFILFRYRQQIRNREKEIELQRERERKEQLAQLDKMKSRFFANISHEFRTPLTLILGQNEQLQSKIDDPALDRNFDMLDRNGRRLLGLINQVLDLSKLESGKLQMKTLPFNLIPFLKNLLFSFESLTDQKKIRLRFEGEQQELLAIVDPEKMERVFFNLISNAIKFTPEQGEISVLIEQREQWLRIGIRDTGIGISKDQLDFIFDRFYQSNTSEMNPSPGTGIGLALAKELVELHEGSLIVDSEEGKGSTFWVELPSIPSETIKEMTSSYAPKLEPTEAPISPPLPSLEVNNKHKAEQILIVEDNPDVRSYLDETLRGFGYQVIQAEDGQIGLQQAQAHQPDLIISDVMMPRMDGFAFAQAIRADAKSSHIPLILLTAKASDESRITGLETGVDDFLTKPFNAKELQVRIRNLIDQRKRLQQTFSTSLSIKPEEVSAVPMDQAFLKKVSDFIEANLGNEQFGVEDLSREAGMSLTHLNRKLNALIGQSAGKFIRSMRLQRAADLLQKRAGTISDIAYDMGFSSPNNFGRAFKKQFGMSPSEFLQQKA